MENATFVTLAIHTNDRALELKRVLEQNNISVELAPVDSDRHSPALGVRVRINETDLPLALKLIETDLRVTESEELKFAGVSGNLLIPVDFSPRSILACKVGFEFSKALRLHPVVLHCYTTSFFPGLPGYSSSDSEEEVSDVEMIRSLSREARNGMKEFARKLNQEKEAGRIPNIKFSSLLREGVPEDVIRDYVKTHRPAMIVMATRGKALKEEELIGSITAEVLDSCRVPVFTVPDNYDIQAIGSIRNVAFLCNLDEHDILSMDAFVRLLSYRRLTVTLIPVNEKAGKAAETRVKAMVDYFSAHYPEIHFNSKVIPAREFRTEFEKEFEKAGLQMIVVPNKKKNIFLRLFNPGIAHRILFERDVPMLALPV